MHAVYLNFKQLNEKLSYFININNLLGRQLASSIHMEGKNIYYLLFTEI